MSTKALAWTLAGGLLLAASAKAEPLDDLRTRLSALRSDQPIRLLVDVKLERRGSAPLHLRKTRLKGEATVVYGPDGVKSLEQKWLSSKTELSLWTSGKGNSSEPHLLDMEEAETLANPVETLDVILDGATLLQDRPVDWNGRPARLLVIRPALFARPGAGPDDDAGPLSGEVSIWLDDSGDPLALERATEIGIPGLRFTQHQLFTFRQDDGRLLVAEAEERTQSRTLGVHRGQETRSMLVSVDHR